MEPLLKPSTTAPAHGENRWQRQNVPSSPPSAGGVTGVCCPPPPPSAVRAPAGGGECLHRGEEEGEVQHPLQRALPVRGGLHPAPRAHHQVPQHRQVGPAQNPLHKTLVGMGGVPGEGRGGGMSRHRFPPGAVVPDPPGSPPLPPLARRSHRARRHHHHRHSHPHHQHHHHKPRKERRKHRKHLRLDWMEEGHYF